ncbi:AAA family ATPase [Pseudanabaena minima]|uniref:AAA family ATPase n=1 Tax=Pseudanabaena minima TaxID=890415 RepID=UPI003DA7EC3B
MFSYSASGAGDTTSFADIIGRIIAGSGAGILIGLIAGCILRFAFTAIMIISSYTVFIAGSVAGFVGAVSLIAVGTTVGTTVGTAVGIAVGIVVGGGLIVISNLPLLWFFLICWFVSASFSPNRQQWSVILITSTFAALGIEYHGWLIVTAIPVVLAGYYRILDFFFFEFLSELPVLSLSLLRYPLPIDVTWQLRHLPPFTSELLWLPITNHDRLLVATFQEDLDEALCIFKAIQSQPLFGYQTTINRALPQIIADQIAKVNTIHELIATVSLNHPTLPILVPSLYQTGETQIEIPKIVEIFPNFYIIAQDIKTALEISNIGLRKRSLERIKEQLILLSKQLSGLIKPQSIERWQTVIDRWQTIIQIEIDLLTQQFQPPTIQNPFEFGKPLGKDSSKLFKGRTTFAEEIVRQILDAKLHTIVLYGPRRCGKSSFLLNLHHLLSSDILPVYIDLQSLSSLQSEADFCFAIVRNIYREAKVQQISLPIHPNREEFHRGPYPHLEDWLYAALTQLAGKRILINFDEFEAISRAMEQGRITTNLFDELRSLIQHWDRLSFLFSGVQTLDELGTNWSSYFISAMPIEMTYLNPDEARELLLNPDPEFALEYDTGIVDQILTLTRCHPYLLQLLGWVLVQLANTTHTQLVTPTLLQSAIPEAYIKGIGYFTNVWEQFTGTTPTEITAGQQQLLALAQGQQPHPTNESAQKSLQRMLRYHIIEKIDNQYKFEVPLIERWVREKST